MIRRVVIGLAMIAGMLSAAAAVPARAADSKQPPDLTGQWRLNTKRSDVPSGPGGAGMRGGRGGGYGGGGWRGGMGGGGMGGGGWGGRGGMGGGDMGGGMGGRGGRGGRGGGEGQDAGGGDDQSASAQRPARLPDLMHVTQTPSEVSFEDSSGAVLQEITTLGSAPDTMAHSPGALVLNGEWKKDKLEITRQSPRGGKITQTISLEGKGDVLVIETKMQGSGDMPSREFKRVYDRVKS